MIDWHLERAVLGQCWVGGATHGSLLGWRGHFLLHGSPIRSFRGAA